MERLRLNFSLLIIGLVFMFSACSVESTEINKIASSTQNTSSNQQAAGERAQQSTTATSKAQEGEVHGFPDPVGFVNDFENILTENEEQQLTAIIVEHQKQTSNEIAIASIPDFGTYNNIDDLALDLANFWGIGVKGKDNGVLVLVCTKERKMRISTGLGLEEKLTDSECQGIINKIMSPNFAKGNIYKGLNEGLLAIISELNE